MVLSSMLTLTSSHAHDGDSLHGSFVSGLPGVVGEIGDMFDFDDILGSTSFHIKSVTVAPEQPGLYSRCSHQVRQWALVMACRYYSFKERCSFLKYWVVENLVTHYYTGSLIQDTGMMPRA